MITIFSTNSRINSRFFRRTGNIGETVVEVYSSTILEEAITQKPVSTTEAIQQIKAERIAVQPNMLPEVEKKRGGIKFGQLGVRLGMVSCLMLGGCNNKGQVETPKLELNIQLGSHPPVSSSSKPSLEKCYDKDTPGKTVEILQQYLFDNNAEFKAIILKESGDGQLKPFTQTLGPSTTRIANNNGILVMEGKKICPTPK